MTEIVPRKNTITKTLHEDNPQPCRIVDQNSAAKQHYHHINSCMAARFML
jgi:hypothetical protein